jgi:hypothetical protein
VRYFTITTISAMPYQLTLSSIQNVKEQLDKLITNKSPLPVIFQTPNPSRLAYALHQAIKAIEHLQTPAYLNLVGAYKIRTGNGAVICEMRDSFIPVDLTPVELYVEDYGDIPDILMQHKGTPLVVFPGISIPADTAEALAAFASREVVSLVPFTLKLR